MQSKEEKTAQRRIPLNVFIAGALSVLMVAMVSLCGMITYSHFSSTLRESMLSTLDSAVSGNANSIGDMITRVRTCVSLFPDAQTDTLDALLDDTGDMYYRYKRYVRIYDKLDNYLDVIISGVASQSALVFIVDDSMGMATICSKMKPWNLFESITGASAQHFISRSAYFEDEPFYQAALANPDRAVWFTREECPGMIFAAQAVRQTALKSSRVKTYNMGIMMVGFDVDWISERLSDNVFLEDAVVYISADNELIYASSDADEPSAVLEASAETDENGRSTIELRGMKYYRWAVELGDGLVMTTLVSDARVRQMAFDSLKLVLVTLTVILIVLLAATVLLVKAALKPIRRLSRHMSEDTLESIETPPLARYIVETDTLYESFNSRNGRILALMDDIRRIEREKREQDFRLLQAQINPHFIYNTLDSVSCMALIAGCDDIAAAMGALAAIMRYNLKEPDKLVPVSTEIEMVKSYIRIQVVRCPGNITVNYALAEESLNCLLPKMSIETLVENAVMHVCKEPRITVSSRIEGDTLTITVSGEGDDGDAALIMRHLAGEVQLATHSTGLGIRNVNQRVKLIFGAQYGLRYERDGNCLNAILTLPTVLTPPPKKEDSYR